MKNRVIIILLVFSANLTKAQVGEQFPLMEGESLTHELINIPNDLNGKYTLLGIAYSKKSENALKTWFSPAYNQFIYKPETPSLFVGNYDLHVFFIPMFTGVKRPAYQKVMGKVEKTIDPKLRPNILFYKGKLGYYKDALKFDGKEIPYFYVLDPEGNVIHSTGGRYSDAKMQEIVDLVEPALKN